MSEQTPIHIAPSLALAVIAGLCVLTLTLPAHADEWVTRKIRYKVERGDNITEIAEDHGVTRAEIIRWNKRRLDNPDMVRPGDVLVIKKRVRVREEGRTAKGPPKPLATIERPEGAYPININGVEPPAPGFAYPYSYDNLMRGFDAAGCTHQGLDIGGVGEHYGVGQPIYAIVKAEVILIGLPENDPRRFGRPDRRRGYERRGSHKIPRTIEVPGYGIVHPFTLDKGSARTGVFLVTRAIGTDLDNHKVRYLHLAAVHPDLQVGDIVEAGQEVGLMGGTGFNYTPPHLHLDVEDASGVRVNPAKYIGLGELRNSRCRGINKHKRKSRYFNKGRGNGKETRVYYRVKKGDSVSKIAKRFKVRSRDIIKWNDLEKNGNVIRPGQKLKIYVYR